MPWPRRMLRFVEVTPLGIRKVRQFDVCSRVRDEVCANLGDQSIAHNVPFSTTGHDLPSCSRRSPEATPLANDAVTLPDDFIDAPEWPACVIEFAPILCQVLCPMYGWKAWRQKVVHDVRCESGQKILELAAVTSIEVTAHDRDVGCFEGANGNPPPCRNYFDANSNVL
jgi:hypothetical protein